MIPFLSIRFIDYMSEKLFVNNFDIVLYKQKNIFCYGSIPKFFENSRILFQTIKDEFEKVNNTKNKL